LFADGAELKMPSQSRVQINDSLANPRGHSSVALLAGWIWAMVAGEDAGAGFEVETATTVVGVRGTELSVGLAQDGTTRVNVNKGTVELFYGSKKSSVTAGKSMDVDLHGKSESKRAADKDRDWQKFQADGLKRLRQNLQTLAMKMSSGMKTARGQAETDRASVKLQLKRYRGVKKEIEGRARIVIPAEDKKKAAREAGAVLSRTRRAQVQSNRVRANAELIRDAARDARANPKAYPSGKDALFQAEVEVGKLNPEKYQLEVMEELAAIGTELETDIMRLDITIELRRLPERKKRERLDERTREFKLKRPGAPDKEPRHDGGTQDHDLPPIIEQPTEPEPEPEPVRQGDEQFDNFP
jgi:hypothetical protein